MAKDEICSALQICQKVEEYSGIEEVLDAELTQESIHLSKEKMDDLTNERIEKENRQEKE